MLKARFFFRTETINSVKFSTRSSGRHGTLQFPINDYAITIKEKHDNGPDRELQKWATFCNHDLKKNYTISRDRELQKWATFCKSRSQEKLYNFSRKLIQFLVIGNCRNGPLSANHDRKKNFTISQ